MSTIDELRKYRIFGLALFDLAFGFLGAFVIHSLLWMYPLDIKIKEKRTPLQYMSLLILMFITVIGLGVIIHRIMGVKSTLSSYLGIN